MCKIEDILKNIEKLREKMNKMIVEKGLDSKEVIHISQELDRLLNMYNKNS